MLRNSLKVNQKIDLVIEDGPYSGVYLSKVAEFGNNFVKVTSPFVYGKVLPLRIRQTIKVLFTGEHAAYMFEAQVIARESKPVALLTITSPVDIIRIQRRDHFRVDAKKKIKFRLIDNNNDENKKTEEEIIESVTIDISGGGVKFIVDEEFPSTGKIELYLVLPEIEKEVIYGEIVNLYTLPDGRAAGVKFTEINKHTREQIITWIFHYQRELRQKGLL